MRTLLLLALLLLASPANAKDKPDASPKLVTIQKERITTLQALVDVTTKLAINGRAEIGQAVEARMELLKVELEAAATDADRVTFYRNAVESLKSLQELAAARKAAARGTEISVLQVKARRLEIEYALELLSVKKPKGGE